MALPVVALVAILLGRSLLALRARWPVARQSLLVALPLARIPSWFETALLGLTTGFAILGFTAGLGPEVLSDAYRVHLVVARQFVAEQRVYGIADQRFSFWPMHGQMLYTAGIALGGTALAKLIHTATGLAVIVAVGVAGRRLGRSRTAGIIAAALFAGLPVAVWELGVGYTDLFVALYGAAALLCLLRLLVSRDWRWAFVLGLTLGFGVAAKLTFGFLVVGTGLALLAGFARRVPLRTLLPATAALATGLGLTAGLWLLRTAVLTRELPGLSLLLGALGQGSGDLSAPVGNLSDFGTGRGVVPLLRLPWDLTFASSRFGENADGFVGFAFLLLLPCLIALPRRWRTRAALIFVGTPFFLWFLTAQYTRYLLPVLAALAAVLGVGVVRLHQRIGRWHRVGRFASRAHAALLLVVLFASLLGYFVSFLIYPGSLPTRVVLGREEPESYLSYTLSAYEAVRYLDQLVTPGTAVAMLPDGPGLYTRARLITPFGVERGLIDATSSAELRATLDRYGITYLIIDHFALSPTWRNFWIVRPEFLNAYADRVFTAGEAVVYRLRPASAVAGDELLRDGSFEAGADQASPWRPLGATPAPVATTSQGRSAIAVAGSVGYYQAVAVQGGQGYRLRYRARSDQPGAIAAMRLDWFDGAGRPIASGTSAVPLTAEWADYTLWHLAPPGATTAVVYVLTSNGMPCWFDDYSLAPAD